MTERVARVATFAADPPAADALHAYDPESFVLISAIADSLAFTDVSFSYTGEHKNLDRVSFTIRRGANVAVVGGSGSGKSTALGLIARFYDPDSGAVTLDGRDLRSASLNSLRGQLGVVFQESFLFNTTIRENIRFGRPDASDEDVEAAARFLGIAGRPWIGFLGTLEPRKNVPALIRGFIRAMTSSLMPLGQAASHS